jgi:hypothetical protein
MSDLPPNSRKAKADTREQIKPVTTATAGRRKKNLGRQFRETFFGGSGREALNYMGEEVVVPAIRNLIYEALHAGLDQVIFGGSRRKSNSTTSGPLGQTNAGTVNYSAVSSPTRASAASRPTLSQGSRARHNFDELIIPTLNEANDVLDNMFEWVSRYGRVTVADLYALTNIRSDHTDEKWGWTSLGHARAVRLPRDQGYVLDLPRPEAIR